MKLFWENTIRDEKTLKDETGVGENDFIILCNNVYLNTRAVEISTFRVVSPLRQYNNRVDYD